MQIAIRTLTHDEALRLTTQYTQFALPEAQVAQAEQTTSAWRNPQIALETGDLAGLYLHYAPVSGWQLVAWS